MHIVALNQFYPPDLAPTGRLLRDLAEALAAHGHRVTILCSRSAYSSAPARSSAPDSTADLRVIRLPAPGVRRGRAVQRLPAYGMFMAGAAARLLCIQPRPDLILAMTTPPFLGAIARMGAAWRRCRHAHWIMDVYPEALVSHGMLRAGGFAARGLARLDRRQLRGAAPIATIGRDLADSVRSHLRPGDATVETIPLWAERELSPWPDGRESPLRRARGWAQTDVVFLYSGNLGRGHRIDVFLRAALALSRRSGIRWVFAGEGARAAEVEAFARAHPGVRIERLPYVPPETLREHLASADVHLVSLSRPWTPSILPSKLQAAFAVARPAIFVGPRDSGLGAWVLESGGGWVVDEDDEAGLPVAVEAAMDPRERERRGRLGLAFSREHFDRGRNCARLVELVEGGVFSTRDVRDAGGTANEEGFSDQK